MIDNSNINTDYWPPAPQWLGEIWKEFQAASLKVRRNPPRHHKPRTASPDGLRTPAEAAAKLGCSIKTLKAHVTAGDLRYVAIGKGSKRPRKMFTDADLNEFIAAQTRKDVSACPSSASRARHSGTSISNGAVIAFTARRNARPDGKPKK